MKARGAMAVALLASIAASCAPPPPRTPLPSITSAPAPTPSASPEASTPISVRFRGRVNCNVGFSFYCGPSLSVLDAGTQVPASWRPADTDPRWDTRAGGTEGVKSSKWTLLRGTPAASPGRHLMVMSLTGASDVASYNPDGSVATELLARCTAEVDVVPGGDALGLVVTFESEPETASAACTIEVAGD